MWHLLPYQAEAKLLKLEDILQFGKSPDTLNVKGKRIIKDNCETGFLSH